MKRIKNIIKKYYISLYDYHVKEIIPKLVRKEEEEVNQYYLDAPILYISYFLNNNLNDYCDYETTNYIIFDKFESSNVENKRKFLCDNNVELKEFIARIKL